MSTRSDATEQTSLDEFPIWGQGYDDLVVKPSNNGNCYHRADTSASQPTPDCSLKNRSGVRGEKEQRYFAADRQSIQGFYDPCSNCYPDGDPNL